MPRLPRLDFVGARHHVMNRGARRDRVFFEDSDRELFLSLLGQFPLRFGVRVHGYALMPNHYHLVLESHSGTLARAMRFLGSEYTRRLNHERGWDGPIFRGRYRNRIVDTDAYWAYLLLYVHTNPIRAGLAAAGERDWTSHRAYLGLDEAPPWLHQGDYREVYGSVEAYRTAYEDVLSGRGERPVDFDPDDLWSMNLTGTVAPEWRTPPELAMGLALAEVSAVTGKSVEDLLKPTRGRGGNPAGWLAAWWLSRRRAISHGAMTVAFGLNHSALSRSINRIEERKDSDPQIAEWVAALEAKQAADLIALARKV